MNFVKKMAVLGSRLNIAGHSIKVSSTHNKLVDEFKKIFKENSNIDFNDVFSHKHLPSKIEDKYLKIECDDYLASHYPVLIKLLKKYRAQIEDFGYGTARKFAQKTDKRIEKAKDNNNGEDVKYYEDEKENTGSVLMDFVSDYEYYYGIFNLLNVKFLGKETSLPLTLD